MGSGYSSSWHRYDNCKFLSLLFVWKIVQQFGIFFFCVLQRTIWFNIGSVDSLERNLENAQLDMGIEPANFVNVYYKNEFEPEQLSGVLPTLLLIGFTVYMFRKGASSLGGKGGGGFFGVGQSTAKLVNPSEIDVRFKYDFLSVYC